MAQAVRASLSGMCRTRCHEFDPQFLPDKLHSFCLYCTCQFTLFLISRYIRTIAYIDGNKLATWLNLKFLAYQNKNDCGYLRPKQLFSTLTQALEVQIYKQFISVIRGHFLDPKYQILDIQLRLLNAENQSLFEHFLDAFLGRNKNQTTQV